MFDVVRRRADAGAMAEACARWDAVAKPLHSLGKLEDLVVKIAGAQGTADVIVRPACIAVFCADHGVVAQGVTQTGQDVTSSVALSIARGEANINLMANVAGADVLAVDMGMAKPPEHPALIHRSVGSGTRDMTKGPAMTDEQALQAIRTGIDLVGDLAARGYKLIGTGEMGIGNTTATSALCCALLGMEPDCAVGRGAGLSDEGLERKRLAVRTALSVNHPDPGDPLGALARVGGFEIAAMTGAFIGGMASGVPVLIDGVISAVAALIAARLYPEAKDFMIPSHMSREPAAERIMAELGFEPVIRADMALGEGTGAAALIPLIDMAVSVYGGSHTFTSLGMAAYTPQGGAV